MKIIVLEGPNGAGKSTIVADLVRLFGFVNYRPFRAEKLRPYGRADRFKAWGVPINTVIDDLYAADAMRELKGGLDCVVFDRSLPSGIAYHELRGGELQGWDAMLQAWQEMLREAGQVLYINLTVGYDAVEARLAGRTDWMPTAEEHWRLGQSFMRLSYIIGQSRLFETMGLDTQTLTPEQQTTAVMSRFIKMIE